jgi:glycosyltransferase involved in cell wall biosynthesis
MKILYLSQYFPPEIGAPAARVFELSHEWVRLGHSVKVVTAFPNHPTGVVPPEYRGRLWDKEVVDGIEVYRNWTLAVPNRQMALRLASQLSFPLSVIALGLPRMKRPDVVLATSPSIFTSVCGLAYARALGAPFVFEVRDLWPQLFIEMGMVKNPLLVRVLETAERFQYRQAQKIVVVTERFKEILEEKGVPSGKLAVIPNGVDLHHFREDAAGARQVREEHGLEGKFVIGYIGTHGVLHGLSSILDAAEALKGENQFRFLFVGHGHERQMLIESARSRHLSNVVFVPAQPRDRIPSYYSACNACIVPLRREAFLAENFVPSKIFEILGCSRPVLATLSGEAGEIVRRSGGGMVIPPEDGPALAAAIRELAAGPGRAQNLGRQGRAFVEAHYDRAALAREYLEVLRAVA